MAEEKQSRGCCDTPYKTTCGGQALIEGILMQGPEKRAIVVRKPDGELEIKTEANPGRPGFWKVPFFRGIYTFIMAMYTGVKALMYSAEVSGVEEEENEESGKFEQWLSRHVSDEKLMNIMLTISVLLGVGMALVLFIFLPSFLVGAVNYLVPGGIGLWAMGVLEGVLKAVIFVLYLFLCSRMKEMRRVFSYHGAEHKTIFCYENGLELTVENVRKQPRHHPRCGTSFLFVVIIISIVLSVALFTPLEIGNVWLRMLLHLLLLPVVMGVTYEFNRYVGAHEDLISRILRAPGLWMQNFTTFEPDDSMIEVGIAALKEVLPEEQGSDRW